MGIHQRPRGTGRVLCCFVTLRPQGPRPGSQKELAGTFLQEFGSQTRRAEPQAFPFLPGRSPAPRAPRPGFPRRCLAAPGACGAVSHRSCSRVWGFGRRSWEGSFCSATKTSAVTAPPGGHKGALPLDARDLSSQTAPSASQGSREPTWLRPCAHRGHEDRAPGSSGGKHLAGDREFASVCFLPPLTKNCWPSATDRLSRLKQVK